VHIGMVHLTAGRFPPDIRVEKEIDALTRAGMRVSVLCPRVSDAEAEKEELRSGATVYRRMIRRQWRARTAWENLTLIWSRYKPVIAEFIRASGADVLHVHDLPMLPTTLVVARAHDLPVVADFHETMSAAIRAYRANQPWRSRIRAAVRQVPSLYRWHEVRSARACEKLIVVVEEGAEPFLQAGIPPEKLVVVANREDETTMGFPLPKVHQDLAGQYADRWVATYIGGMGPHRGVDTVVKGVAAVAERVPNFLLVVVGASDASRYQIARLASEYGASRHVKVLGWEPFDRCLQYMLLSHTCLVPHNDFLHTQMAAPHKLFQYMACGKPVIVSDCRPLKRIVEGVEAGLVFKAGDPDDFARTAIRLAKDPILADRCGANAQRAALSELSWKHDAARLVAMYEAMGDKYCWSGTNRRDQPAMPAADCDRAGHGS